MFSSAFAEGFLQLGNAAAHAEFDLGKAANNELFWEGVQEAFQGQDAEYDNLHLADDKFLSELHKNCHSLLSNTLTWSAGFAS